MALHKREYDEAATLLTEGLTVCEEVVSKAGISCCFEALAVLAVAVDRAEDAARLLGCAQEVKENIGFQLEPFEQTQHDETVLAAIASLGEDHFARGRERGRRTTVDETVALGLALSRAVGAGQGMQGEAADAASPWTSRDNG